MKNAIWGYIFCSLFALVGLGAGIWGFSALYNKYQLVNNGVKTVGKVISLEYSYSKGSTTTAPNVLFTTQNGVEKVYSSKFYTNINPYKVGDNVTLWYDPADTDRVAVTSSPWPDAFPLIFLLTHGGIGFGGLFWLERKRRHKKWMEAHGQEVWAKFVESRHSGKSYRAVCAWTEPLSKYEHEFLSERMAKDPATFLAVDAPVRVLIDPNNPHRYWMDMD
jgi:hypothetical protein